MAVSASPAAAQTTPPPAGPVTVLPAIRVVGESLANYPLFPKAEVANPNFADGSHPMDPFYPGPALAAGLSQGDARVGVMLDEAGHPTDYLIIRYTHRSFADTLLAEAHHQRFAARRVQGVAVPGRFAFDYRFVAPTATSLSGMDAVQQRLDEVRGGPAFVYQPYPERELDGGGLKLTQATVAFIPDGFTPAKGMAIRVLTTFYVDESGHVRLPNVDSAPSPLLIPNAIKAVSHWEFQVPKRHGQPVLVFALWAVGFTDDPGPSAPAK